MKTEVAIDVKNLCSRKLLELAYNQAVDAEEMRSITIELQQRRHYLNELENLTQRTLSRRH